MDEWQGPDSNVTFDYIANQSKILKNLKLGILDYPLDTSWMGFPGGASGKEPVS